MLPDTRWRTVIFHVFREKFPPASIFLKHG